VRQSTFCLLSLYHSPSVDPHSLTACKPAYQLTNQIRPNPPCSNPLLIQGVPNQNFAFDGLHESLMWELTSELECEAWKSRGEVVTWAFTPIQLAYARNMHNSRFGLRFTHLYIKMHRCTHPRTHTHRKHANTPDSDPFDSGSVLSLRLTGTRTLKSHGPCTLESNKSR
jgi:hypothetical protein